MYGAISDKILSKRFRQRFKVSFISMQDNLHKNVMQNYAILSAELPAYTAQINRDGYSGWLYEFIHRGNILLVG